MLAGSRIKGFTVEYCGKVDTKFDISDVEELLPIKLVSIKIARPMGFAPSVEKSLSLCLVELILSSNERKSLNSLVT